MHVGIKRKSSDEDLCGFIIKWAPDLSKIVKTLWDPHTNIISFDVGGISLSEDRNDLPIDDELPLPSLKEREVNWTHYGKIILKHVHHVAENNEGNIGGNSVHFASVESVSGAQTPNTTKSIYFNLYHDVLWMWLALHKKLKLSGWDGLKVKGKW